MVDHENLRLTPTVDMVWKMIVIERERRGEDYLTRGPSHTSSLAIGDAWTVLHLVEADHHIKQEMSSCPNTNYDRKHSHSPE